MSNQIVKDLTAKLNFTLGLYEKFLNICPDDIWKETFGGWPVSQQFFHALAATNMILASITGKKADNPCPGSGDLAKKDVENQPGKIDARKFLADIKKNIDVLPNDLQDGDLTKENETMCKMLGRLTSQAAAIVMMDAHLNYHLGACDAALRQNGLEGAF